MQRLERRKHGLRLHPLAKLDIDLPRLDQDDVGVAVDPDRFDVLDMAGRLGMRRAGQRQDSLSNT